MTKRVEMKSKNLFVLTFFSVLLVVSLSGIMAADASTNVSIVSFTSGNGTVFATSNASSIAIGYKIFNGTTMDGANVTYSLDGAAVEILCNTTAASSTHMHLRVGYNGTDCIGGNMATATTNYIYLNLSEGKHVLVINVTLADASSASNINTSQAAGSLNDTFYVFNSVGFTWGSGGYVDGANLSATSFFVNVTAPLSKLHYNITFLLYNNTVTRILYNTTRSVVAYDNNGTNSSFLRVANPSTNNTVWFSWGNGGSFSSGKALANLWYTYNATIYYGYGASNATLHTKSITRSIRLDTIAPNISAVTCTGWDSSTDKTVQKDATFTCTCSAVDENDTSIVYTYAPSLTPPVSTLGLSGVACYARDSAGNNGTSSATTTYTVVDAVDSSTGSAGGSSSSSTPTGTTFVYTTEQFSTGQTANLAENDQFRVTFIPSGESAVEQHTIAVSDVSGDSATIVISSDPITVKLIIGEEKKVDINGDGIYDVYVKLNGITSGKADFTVKQITESVPEGQTGPVSGGTGIEEVTPTDETGKGNTTVWIVVVILVIVIIATVLGLSRKKK